MHSLHLLWCTISKNVGIMLFFYVTRDLWRIPAETESGRKRARQIMAVPMDPLIPECQEDFLLSQGENAVKIVRAPL